MKNKRKTKGKFFFFSFSFFFLFLFLFLLFLKKKIIKKLCTIFLKKFNISFILGKVDIDGLGFQIVVQSSLTLLTTNTTARRCESKKTKKKEKLKRLPLFVTTEGDFIGILMVGIDPDSPSLKIKIILSNEQRGNGDK